MKDAFEYCEWAISSEKVPKYVKKQCQQWLDIVNDKNEAAVFDEKAYDKITKILKLMIHPDLGRPLDESLESYELLLIAAVFCTKCRDDISTKYYQTAVLKIARKNFKTFVSAVIFILMMLTEPKFSRFFSVAPDLKLSKELQVAINKLIKSSPALNDDLEPVFKTLRSEIRCILTESEYTPLAYSEDKMDGKLPTAFLADEAGAMDSYPVEAMRSGQITLKNKLGIVISTEYPNDDNVMIDETDKAKKTLDGLRDSKRLFALIYEPDEFLRKNDAWQDNDLCIYQSNPVTVDNEYIFQAICELRSDAIFYENKRENFLCKHLNIKYKSLGVEGYIEITKVQTCKKERDDSWWQGRRVFIGLDLSMSGDNVAVAMMTYEGESLEDTVIYSRTMGFIPADLVNFKSKKEGVDYKRLIQQQCCIACGDEVISYLSVENYILSLEEKLGVQIVQIGYDKWNAISSVQKFEAAGYDCVEIKQHSSVLHSPTKLLKEKILSKKFAYEENLMLEINFQNARCTEDTNKNKYVNKKKSEGKVDQVVGNINGMYLIEQELLYNSNNFVIQVF